MKSTPKFKKVHWLYLLILTIALVLVLEGIARVGLYLYFSPYSTNHENQSYSYFAADSATIYGNRPFYLELNHQFQFNELGAKVLPKDVWMPQKKADDYWVFLFGGSSMAGMGANQYGGEWFDITGVLDHPVDETIGYYLEEYLSEKMPDKHVKVFNFAISGAGIYQSRQKYLQVIQQYQPDFVISMDGMNEPCELAPEQTSKAYFENEWKKHPANNEPLVSNFKKMRFSALYWCASKWLYHTRESNKREERLSQLHQNQTKWLDTNPSPIPRKEIDSTAVIRAVNIYEEQSLLFHEALKENNHQGLLFVQPYLAFRDTISLNPTEKALYHYYLQEKWDHERVFFFQEAYQRLKLNDLAIPLTQLHHYSEPLFVDYCHFTNEANKHIAELFGKHLIKALNRIK